MTLEWQDVSTRLRPFVRRRVGSDVDADDVMQNVLLRAHRGIDALDNEERIDAWLHRIARNAIADHYRDRQRHPVARADAPEGSHAPFDAQGDDAAEELASCVALFATLLPSPYREAITLTELEGRTQKEAAQMLGISLSGMKSRVQRGRKKLRGLLEQCCTIEVDVRGRVVGYEPRAMRCGAND